MAFDVSALGNYTKEEVATLKYATIVQGKTADMLAVVTGIKSAEKLNKVATRGVWQTQACGFTASGDTTFSQRTLTVGKVGVYLDWCPKDLEPKYTQKGLANGSPITMGEFTNYIVDNVMENIGNDKEVAIWQGDLSSTNVYLNKFDGFLKLIDADSAVIDATSQADITTSTIRGILQEMITLIPANIKGSPKVKFVTGMDVIEIYKNKLATDNLYHISGQTNGYEIAVENSSYMLVGVPGLTGQDRIIAGEFGEEGNFVIGTDLENEEEQFELGWAAEARKVRFVAEFKVGVQYYFGERIVSYKNS